MARTISRDIKKTESGNEQPKKITKAKATIGRDEGVPGSSRGTGDTETDNHQSETEVENILERRFSAKLEEMTKLFMDKLSELSKSKTENIKRTNKHKQTYHNSRNTQSDMDSGESSDSFLSQQNNSRSRQSKQGYRRKMDPTRWKISFSGRENKKGDENVLDFVMRLEEYAYQDDVPKHELVTLMRNFVTDKADKWYYNFIRKNRHATWKQMKESLLDRFSSVEGDRETRKYIRSRVQYPKESFNDFLTEIESANFRLINPLPEEEILEILMDNMNPALKNATQHRQIVSTTALRKLCDNFEKLWNTSGFDPRRLIEPRIRRFHPVAQISNQDGSSASTSNQRKKSEYGSDDETQVDMGGPSHLDAVSGVYRQNFIVCWNCKDLGHRFSACSMERTHNFCEGCGLAGFNKEDCLRCQKKRVQGNAAPNAGNPGDPRSGRLCNPRFPTLTKQSPNNNLQ